MSTTLRSKMLNNSINICDVCSGLFSKDNLEVHHVDGNRTNNEPDNLKVLCKECHSSVHKGNGPSELTESVEYTTVSASVPDDVYYEWRETIPNGINMSDAITKMMDQWSITDPDSFMDLGKGHLDVTFEYNSGGSVFSVDEKVTMPVRVISSYEGEMMLMKVSNKGN